MSCRGQVKTACSLSATAFASSGALTCPPTLFPVLNLLDAEGQLGHGDDKDKWAPQQVMRFKANDHKYYDLRMPFL